MPLQVEKGTFTTPGSTGNVTYNLGGNFNASQPLKALILWGTYATADGDTGADIIYTMGFGTYRSSTVSQRYVSMYAQDTSTPTVVSRGKGNNAILKGFTGLSPTTDFEIRLDSFTSTSFTLNHFDLPATSSLVFHYFALGGSDISDALVGTFTLNTSAGTQDVTVTSGFGKPDLLFNFDGAVTTVTTNVDETGRAGIYAGIGKDDANQCASYFSLGQGSTPNNDEAYQRADRFIAGVTQGGARHEASLTAKSSWPTDGFQITKNTAPTANRDVFFLALKGNLQSAMGEATVPTSVAPQTNTHSVSSQSVARGIFTFGNTLAASTSFITSDSGNLGTFWMGASDGTREGYAGFSERDGATGIVGSRHQSTTKTVKMIIPDTSGETGTLTSEADAALSLNNAQLIFNDTDTVARAYIYLVLGDALASASLSTTYVRYRIGKNLSSGNVDMTVRLMQGSTEIANWTHTNLAQGFTTYEQVLSQGQESLITDTTNLRLRFVSTVT